MCVCVGGVEMEKNKKWKGTSGSNGKMDKQNITDAERERESKKY